MTASLNQSARYTVALILLLVFFCTNFPVESFQLTPFAGSVPPAKYKTNRIRIESLRLYSTTAASAEESFASTWMQNEKRIEDEMDRSSNTEPKSPQQEDDENVSFGKWEYTSSNYILRPPDEQKPRALLHFLGGALLGAAPQLTYRYLLERLARKGYLIVATPYQLSFDHLNSCDEIIDKFERGE